MEHVAVLKDSNCYRDIFRKEQFIPTKEAHEFFTDADLCLKSDFLERNVVEKNAMYVQLVAYTVIINPKSKKIFIAQRKNGESRLKSSFSIGFGGHVNVDDFRIKEDEIPNPLLKAAKRELTEELKVRNKKLNLSHIGYVRDLASNTPDHIGSVYVLLSGSVSIREKQSFGKAHWVSLEEFKEKYYVRLESWSKYIFDYLYDNDVFEKLYKGERDVL